MKKYLWEELGLDKNFDPKELDNTYIKIKNKTSRTTFAWKVLRDKFYKDVYITYNDDQILQKAGFIFDSLTIDEMDYYNLQLLSTPFDKLKENLSEISNPIVLLSTGGFYPIHEGHVLMMESAKKELEKNGYNVIGGYLSLSHDDYISKKPYYYSSEYERINECREFVKDSKWLMIDPWESLYVRTPINFTNVIERLELYLQKYIDKRIKVAYVFGGDNVEFMYCFEKRGIAVCINRDGCSNIFNEMKNKKKENMFFIENNKETSLLSSRNIRKNIVKKDVSYENVGNYLIRNESILPLSSFCEKLNKDIVSHYQEEFLNKFIRLLSNSFDNKIFIKVINMEYQLKEAYNYLNDQNTINMDSYYRGNYNIDVSRLFNVSSYQDKYIKLVSRTKESINKQISQIKPGDYVLVDDDSVSGSTLNSIRKLLPKEVKVKDTFLLSSCINDKVFDVVDLRDFIIGSINGGLMVKLPDGTKTRCPYVMPYVNLTTRASIHPNKEREFSVSVWKLNKWFYLKLDKNLKLKDMDENFINLMEFVGFNKNDLVSYICDWHIDKLTNQRFEIVQFEEKYKDRVISFLKSVAIDEFGFSKWKNYLENKHFEPYYKNDSCFLITHDQDENIIATIGALKVNEDTIKINSFYVKDEYRFSGIGTKIYNQIVDFCKKNNYKEIILCTYDKFDIATNFYQKRGFKIYKTDEEERWYKKVLKNE